jgi:ABC-type antimicrobial peptide transport system permease subunit
MAMVASPAKVLSGVLHGGMAVVGAGALAGAGAPLAAASLVGNLLFGVSPHDPVVYAVVSLGVAGVGLLATVLPARRAATIDPIQALRRE